MLVIRRLDPAELLASRCGAGQRRDAWARLRAVVGDDVLLHVLRTNSFAALHERVAANAGAVENATGSTGPAIPENATWDCPAQFRVIANCEDEYALWPMTPAVPPAWCGLDVTGTREECSRYIQRIETASSAVVRVLVERRLVRP